MISLFLKPVVNYTVTVILWIYYICLFLFFFSPFYLYAYFFSNNREIAFQKLNWRLHQSFFFLLRIILPRVKWHIAKEVSAIRSSVIIANHLSFLDPILFVSLFYRQKTIANIDHFNLPVFGWILRTSGYIPTLADKMFTEDMITQVKNLTEYLASGGNIFIFPEGTRSRNGLISPFDKGAFRIAKLCRASIKVVVIQNTDKLYPPGMMAFNACTRHVIEVNLAGTIEPDYESNDFSLSGIMDKSRLLIEKGMRP